MQCRIPFAKSPIYATLTRLVVGSVLGAGLLWTTAPLLWSQGTPPMTRSALYTQTLCRRHLKVLGQGLSLYTADYDGKLPALDSPVKLRKLLAAYRIPGGTLTCPLSNSDYQLNKSLGGKVLENVTDKANTLIAWSPKPASDGYYLVLDARGFDRRISSGEMAKMKRGGK